jgi:hypothetical protein
LRPRWRLVDCSSRRRTLVLATRSARLVTVTLRRNYTTILNIVFGVLALMFVVRFLRTGGPMMLRAVNAKPKAGPSVRTHGALPRLP